MYHGYIKFSNNSKQKEDKMSPVVRIPDSTYKRLESQATGFDTPANVIERLLDYYASNQETKISPVKEPVKETGTRYLNPDSPDDLHFAKIINAQFGNTIISRPNWNKIVYAAHRVTLRKHPSFDKLEMLTNSHIVQGERGDCGFHYIEDLNISIQNVDANTAWINALALAKHINVPIKVTFRWRNRRGAAHPNEKGEISWKPE
jgi:hypothetical protein